MPWPQSATTATRTGEGGVTVGCAPKIKPCLPTRPLSEGDHAAEHLFGLLEPAFPVERKSQLPAHHLGALQRRPLRQVRTAANGPLTTSSAGQAILENRGWFEYHCA